MQHSRRRFVQASAAVATAAFPILGANDRIQVGVVGLGGRGTSHIQNYSSLDTDCRLAAVCDVNQAARERAVALVRKTKNYAPKEYPDMRAMFESKDVDAVSIATPNHWHALAAIWAVQAGKDVYVEKPASHNVFEGRQMVAAARKHNRMVQVGSQGRSVAHKIEAMKLLREGVIGHVYHARGLCFRRRFSIGHTPDEPVPAGLNWDYFLGPAQMKPYSSNKFAYNWHWFWDTGNGDIGNQGVHEMDGCLWGFGWEGWPKAVASTGGKFEWKDDQETPNTLQSTFLFDGGQITFDTRNLPTPPEATAPRAAPNYTGNVFYGDLGYMVVDPAGYEVWKSTAGNISGEVARGAGAARAEKYEKVREGKAQEEAAWSTTPHMRNFFEAIRRRDHKVLNADIEIGARAAAFCHLGNISYRVGRSLQMTADGKFVNAPDANALLTRNYRKPYTVPERV
jgi:predicted dehydrogenase